MAAVAPTRCESPSSTDSIGNSELYSSWLETQQLLAEQKQRTKYAEQEASRLQERSVQLALRAKAAEAELASTRGLVEQRTVAEAERRAALEAELRWRCSALVSLRRQFADLTTCTLDVSLLQPTAEVAKGKAVEMPIRSFFAEAGLALKFYPRGSLSADADRCSLYITACEGWKVKYRLFVDGHSHEGEHKWDADGTCSGASSLCPCQPAYAQVGVQVLGLQSPAGTQVISEVNDSDSGAREGVQEPSAFLAAAEAERQAVWDLELALAALLRAQVLGKGMLPRILRTSPQEYDMASLLEALRTARPQLLAGRGEDAQDPLEQKLKGIIGLEPVKAQVRELRRTLQANQRKLELGAPVVQTGPLHMVFRGNPGCGKTSVARLMAELLRETGAVQGDAFVEVQRGDLVASYVGQTASRTREVIERAKRGVLFVDEAYRLCSSGPGDYGQEAIEELMKDLTTGDPVVCLAGYPREMDQFLSVNPGLRRRFPLVFDFPDYTPQEIAQIFFDRAKSQGYRFGASAAEQAVVDLIEQHTTRAWRALQNGALADLLLERTSRALDARLPSDFTRELAEVLDLIDIEEAARGIMKGSRA